MRYKDEQYVLDTLGDLGFHTLPYRKRFDTAARNHDAEYDEQGNEKSRGLSFEVNGQSIEKKAYALRPGGIAMGLLCAKSDYSDSSMSLNTWALYK